MIAETNKPELTPELISALRNFEPVLKYKTDNFNISADTKENTLNISFNAGYRVEFGNFALSYRSSAELAWGDYFLLIYFLENNNANPNAEFEG